MPEKAENLRRIASSLIVMSLFLGLFAFIFTVQPARAVTETITINPNGSISSPVERALQYTTLDYAGNHCLNFTAANEREDCGQNSIYQSAKLTIETWVKPRYNVQPGSSSKYGDDWGTIACLRQQSSGSRGGWWFGFNYVYGNLTFIIDETDTEFYSSKNNWSNDSWYYVAVTYDPTLAENNLVLYVNGTVDSYHNSTAAIVYSTPTLQIGSQANTPIYYLGLLDEVRLWNVSNTQTEIQNSWDHTLNNPNETATGYPDLVGCWHFDNVTNGNYLDYSIYHNNAVPSTPGPALVAPGAPIIASPDFSTVEIVINPDGSITPFTANITTSDNLTYTFTDNNYLPIIVQRSSITINGMGHALQAPGGWGFTLQVNNVTIKNTTIRNSYVGIALSSDCTVSGSNITNNNYGVYLMYDSDCTVSGNNITNNVGVGIRLYSSNCTVSGNNIGNNSEGVYLASSSICIFSRNNITNNYFGVGIRGSSGSTFYHNNFVGNTQHVYSDGSPNMWDNGYPSGGNYWSNYTGVDQKSGPSQNLPGSDGIGYTPYTIDMSNIDRYPLMRPWIPFNGQTIYIRANGNVDPTGAPIQRSGDRYTIAADIASTGDGIWIQKNNITLDGSNHVVEGQGANYGISLAGGSNVTIMNTRIETFSTGVQLLDSSHNCTVSGNTVTYNALGVLLTNSFGNIVSDSNITNNGFGLALAYTINNTVSGNNITNSTSDGVVLYYAINNTFYHSNFVGNTQQVSSDGLPNTWDNGYPSGGNYWNNYTGVDLYHGSGQNVAGGDGLSDTNYTINANNVDRYPLMGPFKTLSVGTWNSKAYSVDIVSNSTITKLTFNPYASPYPTLSFNVTDPGSTYGFCRVSIPTALMWVDNPPDGWFVYVGGTLYGNQTIITYGNYTYIYFTYTPGAQMVKITSTNAVPEFQPLMLLPLLMIITLLGAFILKRKRK